MDRLASRPRGAVLVLVGGWLVACSLDSKSIGDPAESSSSDSSSNSSVSDTTSSDLPSSSVTTSPSDSSDSGSPAQCVDNPLYGCTVPFDGGWSCGESPYDDLDENCCPRPTCGGEGDCADDEACLPIGSSGFGCTDFPTDDGGLTCSCAANPTSGRPICIPDAAVEPFYCTGYSDEESCGAAPEVPYDAEHAYYCVWATVHSNALLDGACEPGLEPEERCISATYNTLGGDPGCGSNECTLDGAPLETGVARFLDEVSIEYISLTAYFCGSEQAPVGDWLPCDDPSFGACGCDCG